MTLPRMTPPYEMRARDVRPGDIVRVAADKRTHLFTAKQLTRRLRGDIVIAGENPAKRAYYYIVVDLDHPVKVSRDVRVYRPRSMSPRERMVRACIKAYWERIWSNHEDHNDR